MKTLIFIWLLIFELLFGGCISWRTVTKIEDNPVGNALQETRSLAEVKAAIFKGGEDRKWNMKEVAPGHVVAAIVVRNVYKVSVDILYNEKTYSIRYKDSENMKRAGPFIHRKYNGWVKNLDRAIQKNLYKI